MTAGPPRFKSPLEERIHRRLLLVGEGPAQFFVDACEMIDEKRPRSVTHLVGHLLREIESAIRDVFQPLVARSAAATAVAIEKSNRHGGEIRAVLAALEIAETDPVAERWLRMAGHQPDALHRRAHRDNLAPPRPFDAEFVRYWSDYLLVLDNILARLEERYAEHILHIEDLLSRAAPTRNDVSSLLQRVPYNDIAYGHFFRAAPSSWFSPLHDEEFFRYASSPAAEYLARIASDQNPPDPEKLLGACISMGSADEPRIQAALSEAASTLPAELGNQWAHQAKRWLAAQERVDFRNAEPLTKLSMRLLSAGKESAALEILGLLLQPLGDPSSIDGPATRLDLSTCESVLESVAAEGGRVGGAPFLRFLRDILLSVLPTASSGEHFDDAWLVLRPAIEDHDQNRRDDLRDFLVSALRDAALEAIGSGRATVAEVFECLSQGDASILRRIALHVARVAGTASLPVARELLLNFDFFDQLAVYHEHMLLLRDRFGDLSSGEQAQLLEAIRIRPEGDPLEARLGDRLGREPSPEEKNRAAKLWQRDRLFFLTDSLSGESREWYEGLLTELGPPDESVGFHFFMGTAWVGPDSPIKREELANRPPSDVVAFIEQWKPRRGWMEESPEGLGVELTADVSTRPAEWSEAAATWGNLAPVYVAAIFRGFTDAVSGGRRFEWQPILAQMVALTSARSSGTRDWSTVNLEIARLMHRAMTPGECEVEGGERSLVWRALEPSLRDPWPDRREEAARGEELDPHFSAINSARSEALRTAIVYGFWLRRRIGAADLSASPELREELDTHLDPSQDASLAVRSVYGSCLDHLIKLDREWLLSRLARIFPGGDLEQAAWDAYVAYTNPTASSFAVLADQYAQAIDRLQKSESKRSAFVDAERRLAEHLMQAVWLGTIDLAEPGNLADRFFATARPELRAHALECVGSVFLRHTGELASEVVQRAAALWEKRTQAWTDLPTDSVALEVREFGWWFASGKFDLAWAFPILQDAMRRGGGIEGDHFVADRLVEEFEAHPREVLTSLRILVETARDTWQVMVWESRLGSILERAVSHVDSSVQGAARELVGILVARGSTRFAKLLDQP